MKKKVIRAKVKSDPNGVISAPKGEVYVHDDLLLINFNHRYTYESFEQRENHLYIMTTYGKADIVFAGEVPTFVFDHFEKDQLCLKRI